jgi:ribosome recycling factor
MDYINEAKSKMEKAIESAKDNFAGIRTGRANPAIFANITAEYYGNPTPLKNVANMNAIDARTVQFTVFDKSMLSAVEKALRDSDLGVNPMRDGDVIRVTMPELTKERRTEYVKLAKQKSEDGKVALRNVRHKIKQTIDADKKSGEISEDDAKGKEKKLDELVKDFSAQIDALLKNKEAELMEV